MRFGDIYQYLSSGLLPSKGKRARSILRDSENFVLVQDILFRIDKPASQNELTLLLCIPEQQAPFIISMFHESLLSCHQGVSRTYNTIKRRFFIPGLWDKLVTFIKSCSVCQERKTVQNRDVQQERNPRIFTDYAPFSEVHVDIKHMFPATDGSNYLVVATCVQTRYVISIPVRNIEANTIAEVLLQRLVFQFGPPRRLVTDKGTQFTARVFNIMAKTLGIEQLYVSPENHGSLVCERSIQSISNMLLSNLQGRGRAWAYYVQAVCHAYNTFAHTSLGGYSPFELVYMRQPPDWLNIKVDPREDIPLEYSEYVDRLRNRLRTISSTVLDMHNQNQERAKQKHADSLRSPPAYEKGQLVYFLMPSSGALNTNTKKFIVRYVGPVKIRIVMDRSHVILEDLENKLIAGIHHTNRIKPAQVRGQKGNITNSSELAKALQVAPSW